MFRNITVAAALAAAFAATATTAHAGKLTGVGSMSNAGASVPSSRLTGVGSITNAGKWSGQPQPSFYKVAPTAAPAAITRTPSTSVVRPRG